MGPDGASWDGSWPWLALAVFATHLPFFAWRWWRTGQTRFAATTVTFGLLTVTYMLRLFEPELHIAGLKLHEIFQKVAWTSASVSIYMLVAHVLRSNDRNL